MKKFILATMMVLGMASMASAQTATDGKTYVGVSAGAVTSDAHNPINTFGVNVGREVLPFLAAEVAYSYTESGHGIKSGQTLFGNAIGQYKIPGTIFTPYALVGAGYGWDRFGDRSLYNFGAGLKTEVSKSTDFDVRFRQVRNFGDWDKEHHDNIVTAGLNFKF